MKKPKILVMGSMNMDLFLYDCNRIASYGESVQSGEYKFAPGGKGSNQAFATAILGGDVSMVGRLGCDEFGNELIASLNTAGVNTDFVVRDTAAQTGLGLMLIHPTGKYVSYGGVGANKNVCAHDVELALDAYDFDMVIMQLEVPLDTVYQTISLAQQRKIPVFLDAGPAMSIPLENLAGVYILSPNEAETKALTGIDPQSDIDAIKAAKMLYQKAAPTYVVLKLGQRGALVYDGQNADFVPGFAVNAVDSTAAGDTFGGALALKLCQGEPMKEAVIYANAAAAICVSRQGAQMAIPTPQEVQQFLDAQNNEI